MKALVVEDDFTSRRLLQNILLVYGECDIAVNGEEAVEAFRTALQENSPYDLICLDIMMPVIDGQQALRMIREIEKEQNIRSEDQVNVIMTTALDDPRNVIEAFHKGGAAAYLIKPVHKFDLLQEVRKLGLIA